MILSLVNSNEILNKVNYIFDFEQVNQIQVYAALWNRIIE